MESIQKDAILGIETGFRRIRHLRAWLKGLFVGVVPFFAFLGWLKAPDWLFSILAVIGFSTWTVLVVLHGFARCPICHKLFNVNRLYGNPFTSKCLNCGASLRQHFVPNMPRRSLAGLSVVWSMDDTIKTSIVRHDRPPMPTEKCLEIDVDLSPSGMRDRVEKLWVMPSPEGNYVIACFPFFCYGIGFVILSPRLHPAWRFAR